MWIRKALRAFGRGAHCRCPNCGEGKIFLRWGELHDACLVCGCALRPREPDTWFFMYVTIAAQTGAFVLFMLLFPPRNQNVGRFLIAAGSFGLYLLTHAPRKGMAIALDYLIDSSSEHPRFPLSRQDDSTR